jgi:hypothetical protein
MQDSAAARATDLAEQNLMANTVPGAEPLLSINALALSVNFRMHPEQARGDAGEVCT